MRVSGTLWVRSYTPSAGEANALLDDHLGRDSVFIGDHVRAGVKVLFFHSYSDLLVQAR